MAVEGIDIRRAEVEVEYEVNEDKGTIELLDIQYEGGSVHQLFDELDLMEEIYMKVMVKMLESNSSSNFEEDEDLF